MKSDRVCFIDIDGVIIPFGGNNTYNQCEPSPDAISVLKQLVAEGYKLILHSTWRHGMLDEAYELFESAGIPLEGHVDPSEVSKAEAIALWLIDAYAGDWPKDILVIDDEEIIVRTARLIRPDFRKGLTPDSQRLDCDSASSPHIR